MQNFSFNDARFAAAAGFVNAAARAAAMAFLSLTPFWRFYGADDSAPDGLLTRPLLLGAMAALLGVMILSIIPFAVGLARAVKASRAVANAGALLTIAATVMRAAADMGALIIAPDLAARALSGDERALALAGTLTTISAINNFILACGLALMVWATAKDGRFQRWLVWVGGGAAWSLCS